MPRLTAELIAESPQFTNPVKDWELDLRGNKVAVIENLGATLDQFDTIDFSENEIRKLDGFPLLRRLKNVLANNNNICRIATGLETCLPSLETLVLTNNTMEELSDLEPLASLTGLVYLSLLRNPVVHKPMYRYFVINLLPSLRVLDFRRIRMKEKMRAKEMFGEKKKSTKKTKTFIPGRETRPTPASRPHPPVPSGPSSSELAKIREAIAAAKSLEEVQQLEALLKAGQLPTQVGAVGNTNGIQVVEEDMED